MPTDAASQSSKHRRVQASKLARAAGAGRQARGRDPNQVVPEFAGTLGFYVVGKDHARLKSWAKAKNRRLEAEATFGNVAIPKNSVLISVNGTSIKGCGGAVMDEVLGSLAGSTWATAGTPWSPEEFAAEALRARHPFEAGYPLRACTARAVARSLQLGPAGVEAHRTETLGRWRRRAAELEAKEKSLHETLDPNVEAVVHDKAILLFRAVLEEIGHPDLEPARCMAAGFPVVGHIEDSLAFPAKTVEAKSKVEELFGRAKAAQASARAGTRTSGDKEIDREVYEATLAEVGSGRMRGPFTQEQLDNDLGLWTPARRFGLRQSGKIRPIDDFSEMGQNATLSTDFKVDLGGVDEAVAIAKAWANGLAADGAFEIIDEAGYRHVGMPSPEWKSVDCSMVGACVDLEAAFRQLPRLPAHAAFTVISVFNPVNGKAELFQLDALAFGQGAAVYGFNRTARAIDAILAELLITTGNYVDDYPVLVPTCLGSSTVLSCLQFSSLFGWRLKRPDELATLPSFTALGVVLDCADAVKSGRPGTITISNKASRVKDDVAEVNRLLAAGSARAADVRRLRGRLQFACGQVFGKCGAFAARHLKELAACSGSRQLRWNEVLALQWWAAFLPAARPRSLEVGPATPPVCIFVDGAVEDCVTIGGVLLDKVTGTREMFGTIVPEELATRWREGRACGQVIGQAELAPVAVAARLWASAVSGRNVVVFIDNDSAREALIRGYSPSLPSAELIATTWLALAACHCRPWFARVPGPSNSADGPSRLDFGQAKQLGAVLRYLPGQWEAWAMWPAGGSGR